MAEPSVPAAAPAQETEPCTMRQLLLYFLSLGTFGFGGPIALAGYMQRDLVERRRWISKQDYLEGLALAQLTPGPLAAHLAISLGRVRARVRSEEHTSELQSQSNLVCRLLLEKKKSTR